MVAEYQSMCFQIFLLAVLIDWILPSKVEGAFPSAQAFQIVDLQDSAVIYEIHLVHFLDVLLTAGTT